MSSILLVELVARTVTPQLISARQLELRYRQAAAIDLAAQTLSIENGPTVTFPIDSFSKTCVLEGIDEIGYIPPTMQVKLYRVLQKSDDQLVYYSPGVGTVGDYDSWQIIKQHVQEFLGLVTGYYRGRVAIAVKEKEKVRILPSTIYEAIALFESSKFMEKILGINKEKYLEFKKAVAMRSPAELGIIVKRSEIIYHHEVFNQILWNTF